MARSQWGIFFETFNDHRESGPRFNVSSEGRCFLQHSNYTGALGPTQTTV